MAKDKKKYLMGRKHKQFYVCLDKDKGQFTIKPCDENLDYMKLLAIMVDDGYIFQGSYAECHVFKKGYDYGVSGYRLVVKSALKQVMEQSFFIRFEDEERMGD